MDLFQVPPTVCADAYVRAETVAARMREYHALGVENFVLRYPHLEEAYRVAELLFPRLPLHNSGKPRTVSRWNPAYQVA